MWFYAVDGIRHGPLGLEQLAANLHGLSDPTAIHVWRDGMPAWQLAGTVPEVAVRLAPPVPRVTTRPPMFSDAVEPDGEVPVALAIAVATEFRRLVLLFGGLMLVVAKVAYAPVGPSGVQMVIAALAAFGLLIAMAVTAYRLMALLEEGVPVLWAIATFLPVVNLLVLLVISSKAQAFCRKRGIYVGLLGPHPTSIEWLRRG
jgi:hypothetical protein